MWVLDAIVLVVGALAICSLRAWLSLLNEERTKENTTSKAERWINSPLKPPE